MQYSIYQITLPMLGMKSQRNKMQHKTFRLFISSTFNDLKEERNTLQNEVFPAIKEFCQRNGFNFEPIDLRWGVTNEAGLDHQAMDICINEVKKVLNYPRPNFLVILGNRYGWIPIPNKIESKYFHLLLKTVSRQEKLVLETWYKKDMNSIPPYHILQPIEDILVHESNIENAWHKEEAILREIFLKYQNLFPEDLHIGKSATEQEIISGILESAQQIHNEDESILCVERKIVNLEDVEDKTFHMDNPEKLETLKQRLYTCTHPKIVYKKFRASLLHKEDGYKPDKEYLDDFAILVKNYLRSQIEREMKRLSFETKNESKIHQNFRNERANIFVGRNKLLENVQNYVQDNSSSPLVFYGDSGVGKSAFIAMASTYIENLMEADVNIITRFVGISEISSQPKTLLDNITLNIYKKVGQQQAKESDDYAQSVQYFLSALHTYSNKSKKKLIIFIDALDQFATSTALEWIENELPQNVKLVLSTLAAPYGNYYDILKTKIPKKSFLHIEPLGISDGEEILRSWLHQSHRRLTNEQFGHVISLFKQNGLPLFLKILFERALEWHSYDDDYKLLQNTDLIEAIADFFASLIYSKHHPKALVAHTLGYISASKHGIAEHELVGVLSEDQIVMQEIANPFHKLPSSNDATKLPSAVWSRLYYDLLKYFSFVEYDNVSLLNFYHRKIKECARDYYYQTDSFFFHSLLLEYFWNQPFEFTQNKEPNLRKLSELPYQCIQSKSFSKFLQLYSVDFIDMKVTNKQKENLFQEIYDIFISLETSGNTTVFIEKFTQALAQNVLQFLLEKVQNPSKAPLKVEEIHAYFVYRENKTFYIKLLELACSENELVKISPDTPKNIYQSYFTAFRARYANMIRREAKLEKAAQIYMELEERSFIQMLDGFEQSRIYYDIGYIAYLSGEFDKAIEFLHKSASIAQENGAEVSRYISICVATRIEMLRYDRINKFKNILLEALEIFEKHKFDDPSAKRWIKNVHAHLFEVGFAERNIAMMHKYYDLLLNDEWMLDHQQVKRYSSFTPYEARIALLEEDYIKAAELFEGYIYQIIPSSQRETKESIAKDYYDYLLALRHVDKDRFQHELQKALKLPDKPGNQFWKEKIYLLKN